MTTPYDLPSPTTYSWNVAIQKQIGPDWVASLTYLGGRVQHLDINQAINYGQIVTGPIVASGCAANATNCNALANVQTRRVLSLLNPAAGQFIGNMDTWYPYGTQRYNGLLSSIQKKLSRGMSLSANWTWSHCTGYYQGFNSKPEETATNPYDPLFRPRQLRQRPSPYRQRHGRCPTPSFLESAVAYRRHRMAAFRHLPLHFGRTNFGSGRNRSGIQRHQSPAPNLTDPTSVYTGQACGGCFYLNKSAFAPQALGTVGNLGWKHCERARLLGYGSCASRESYACAKRSPCRCVPMRSNVGNNFVPSISTTAALISPAVPAFAALNNGQFGQILTA